MRKQRRISARFPSRVGRSKKSNELLSGVITSRRDAVVTYIFLVILALMFAFPLYAAIAKSLEINGFQNYVSLFKNPIGQVSILQTYANTFAIGALHALIVLFVASTAGYAFSRLRFRGREIGFAIVLLFLAVPAVAIIVPVYRITQELGLFNNLLGVALPEAILTTPFGVLLLRNQGRNMPASLFEAAAVDGASHARQFRSIFLPMARPGIVNLTILCFVWSMQDFLWPSFIFTDPGMSTAAKAVATLSNSLGQGAAELARYNASLVLLAVPAIFLVVFGLRFIISGFSSGAVKE